MRGLPGYPRYKVTEDGQVIGPKRRSLTGYLDRDGYHCVLVYSSTSKRSWMKVHRAVVMAYIGPIPSDMVINHKNGIKADNRFENLEIVTPSQNTKHGYDVLGRKGGNTNPVKGESHHHARLSAEVVREIRGLYDSGQWTQVALAAHFGMGQNHISRLVRRESWKHVT